MGLEIKLFNKDLDDDGGGDMRQDDRKVEEGEEDKDERSNRLDERRRSVLVMEETRAMHINNKRTPKFVTGMRLDDKDGDDNVGFLLHSSKGAPPGIGKSAEDCIKRTEKPHYERKGRQNSCFSKVYMGCLCRQLP